MNNAIKTDFKVYVSDKNSHWKSSFFDLIPGDKETKQTKGLACLMSFEPDLIFNVLELKSIKDLISIKKRDVSQIEVIAEMVSLNKTRVDITVIFHLRSGVKKALLIEAKNSSIKSNQLALENQIKNYLKEDFSILSSVDERYGIALTKYEKSFNKNIASITWNDVINILHKSSTKNKDNKLLKDYFNFITGVDKKMNYYEEEVLTIPAGNTKKFVENWSIYECPVSYHYGNKKSLYIGFRNKGGGVIDKLHKLSKIVEINFEFNNNKFDYESLNIQLEKLDIDNDQKDRIIKYIDESKPGDLIKNDKRDFSSNLRKVFILSTKDSLNLKHNPRPEKNNSGLAYYRLAELLDSDNKILKRK